MAFLEILHTILTCLTNTYVLGFWVEVIPSAGATPFGFVIILQFCMRLWRT